MNISISNETTSRVVKKNIIAEVNFFCKQIELLVFDLSIAFVGDERMIAINSQYLQHEGSTDIITFDYSEDNKAGTEGELIICVDQAKRQSKEYSVTLENELTRLLIHGLLHLRGYDDKTTVLRKKMTAKENELIELWYQNQNTN